MRSILQSRIATIGVLLTLISVFTHAQTHTFTSNNVAAGVGALDPDFGLAGKVITDLGFDSDAQALALALQSDGRIVAAGRASIPLHGFDFALARYNIDGTLDAGFGIGGRVITDFFAGNDRATSIVIQPDGRIVVGGDAFNTNTGNTDFALARYNPDGSPDTSFDVDGKLTTDLSTNDAGNALVLRPDGRILLAGSILDSQLSKDFALLSYNPDGRVDANFGTNGRVITDFSNLADEVTAAIIKPGGLILAVGFAGTPGKSRDFALAQYNADGTLDSTFGVGGKATVDFFGSTDEARAVALQTDGRIVVAGSAFNGASLGDFALARLDEDGSLDSSFRSSGKVTADFSGNLDAAEAVVVLPDGRIVAGGRAFTSSSNSDFALVSYKPNGKPDSSFGAGGRLITDFFGSIDQTFDVVVDSSGRLIAAGSAAGINLTPDFALARYVLQTGSQRSKDSDIR